MKKGTKTKKITLEAIADLIKTGNDTLSRQITQKLSKKIDDKIDGLAIIVANSFEGMEERLTKNLTEEIQSVEEKLTTKIEGLGKRIDDLAENKVSKIAFKEIETTVSAIKKKLIITK